MKNRRLGSFIAISGLSATALYAAQPTNPSSVLSDGFYNTAMGTAALSHNTTPAHQCAPYAFNNTPGSYYMLGCGNTAAGFGAMDFNTTGAADTALGAGALFYNTTGAYNTAVGTLALFHTTTGSSNQAFGAGALFSNTTGKQNTALGEYSLFDNSSGNRNVTVGSASMYRTTTGSSNTASGYYSLLGNTTGSYNVAIGANVLRNNATGTSNTMLGYSTGSGLHSGNFNTYVGYGITGVDGESNVTRIGAEGPVSETTYISGIYNTPLSGNAVVVTSTGQLGVAAVSSERFKTDVAAMGGNSNKLEQLRPVTFKLKTDPSGTLQYGLIAEEVANVYPELVIRDQNGRIDGVRYDELAPMLLNQMQKEHEHALAQDAAIAAQAKLIEDLKTQISQLNDQRHAVNAPPPR